MLGSAELGDVGRRHPAGHGELGGRGFAPVRGFVGAERAMQAGEIAPRAIGEHDWVGELGDELLHPLANPPRRVPPERRAA
jgi:hypothetical protein